MSFTPDRCSKANLQGNLRWCRLMDHWLACGSAVAALCLSLTSCNAVLGRPSWWKLISDICANVCLRTADHALSTYQDTLPSTITQTPQCRPNLAPAVVWAACAPLALLSLRGILPEMAVPALWKACLLLCGWDRKYAVPAADTCSTWQCKPCSSESF